MDTSKISELKIRAFNELGPNAFTKTAIWGTYGKDGRGPLEWVLLHERETDHLQAILRTQTIGDNLIHIIHVILSNRNVIPEEYNHKAYLTWAKKMIESPDTDPQLLGMVTDRRKFIS